MKNLNYFNRLINIMCLSALIVLCAGCQKAPDSQTDPDSSIPENVMQTEPELITDPGADSGGLLYTSDDADYKSSL
ncbi:MAG: hypothetical protein K2G25_09635, partial [Oscillospiraceae bacterium]|nr:hypothetical protein [Oscillospiraceae bacterium]